MDLLLFQSTQTKHKRFLNFLSLSIPLLIGIFLFFNPFPHTTAIKEISFYLSLAFLVALLYLKEFNFSLQSPLAKPLLLFIAWCTFGIFFALNKSNSLHDIYAHLLKYVALYYLLINFINSRKRFIYLTWTIIASASIFSIYEIFQFYFIMGNSISIKLGLFHMTEVPSNIIGIIAVFGLLLALSLISRDKAYHRRTLLFLCIASTALATLLTQTRGSLIAMTASFILMFPKNKKVLTTLIIILLASLMFLPVKNILKIENILNKLKSDNRIQIGFLFIEMTKDYPVYGIGFGMQTYYDKSLLNKYNVRLPSKYRQEVPVCAPHNFLIDVAVRTGIVGLSLFLYVLFASIRMSLRVIRQAKDNFIRDWELCCTAALIAILIQGLFENTMSGPPAIILYTILAMMTILWRLHSESETASKESSVSA